MSTCPRCSFRLGNTGGPPSNWCSGGGQRGLPSQSLSVQPPCGLPTTTMWPVFGNGSRVSKELSGFLTFIKTQTMTARWCENATGFRSPLS